MPDTSGFYIDNERDSSLDQGIRVNDLIYSSGSGPFRILEGFYYGRRAAIKCLKEEYASSSAHINILRREGELWSTLHHTNIVQIFSVREVNGLGISIIMEYVEASTLADFLKSRILSLSEARRLMASICETVDYIHSCGVIHRDLKPENILISPGTLDIKIIDFGLSHGKSFVDLPISGGTHNYSAPEQFEKSAVSDPSADIWSIGKLMQVIYPVKKRNKVSALIHPAERAWTLTATECMNTEPGNRPHSAEAVKTLFARRLKRYYTIPILAASLAAAILATGILLRINQSPTKDTSSPHRLTAATSSAASLLPADSVAELAATKDSLIAEDEDLPDAEASNPDETDAGQEAAEDYTIDPFYSNDYVLENYANVDGKPQYVQMKLSDPVPKAFTSFLRSTIKKNYKWHLNLLKTLTTQDQADLAFVGHWQYKAYLEYDAWLSKQRASKKIDTAQYLVLLSFASEAMDSFIKAHDAEEYNAKVEMSKRTGMTFTPYWEEPYEDNDDLIRVHQFQQDGKWHESVRLRRSYDR